MSSIVCGIAINDSDCKVSPTINGKQVLCPIYNMWKAMINRCYDEKCQSKKPSYAGCSVCPEWLIFSNFKSWVEHQDWQGKQLDKDILLVGNKVYSPETCVFLDLVTNSFLTDAKSSRGQWPIGTYFDKYNNRFKATCRNPFTKKKEHLGNYTCPTQAHLAWKRRKHELACQLADTQTDQRAAKALRLRYA